MTFEEYVVDWFHSYLQNDENENISDEWFEAMGYTSDQLNEEQDTYNFLMNLDDGEEIWHRAFSNDSEVQHSKLSEIADTEALLFDWFVDAVRPQYQDYSHVKDLLIDMAGQCIAYDNPLGFFKDLAYGGCISGMVGMFIYNSDCKDFYIKNIDSMEDYIEMLEGEMGEPVRNREHLPHYTFVCWVCYEELGNEVARTLWPETF